MSHYRNKIGMSERQMALVGLLHGLTMGAVTKAVERSPCTAEVKASVEKGLLAP